MTSPIRPTDEDARTMAADLLTQARFCTIATLEPDGAPLTARIAFGRDAVGHPISLVSTLSQHTQAMMRDVRCSLLIGEPAEKGDPLTHPRISLQCDASFVARAAAEFSALRSGWLDSHPKSRLYIDFADFHFVRFTPRTAFLNGGFGKAYELTSADLGLPV